MSTTTARKFALPALWLAAFGLVLPLRSQTSADVSASPAREEKIPTETAAAKSDEPAKLASVEVTGSRIRTLVGEQTAIPVVSFSEIELEHRGVARLADIRWAIPQLAGSVGFNDNLMNGGPSRASQVSTSLNLRGLGGNSTLVLIDGRRVPHTGQSAPGGAGGREDFNIDGIPVSAIERVDVLPQGAGAIYGSEAIAGVINIVLKKDYQGAEMQLTYDNAFDSDVAQITGTVTGGLSKGKFRTFFTVSQTDQHALASRDRWFTARSSSLQYYPYDGAGTLATGYYVDSSTANLPGLGKPAVGIPAGTSGNFTAADANAAAIGSHYDPAAYTYQIDAYRSRSVVWKATYDVHPWLRPYLQVRWSEFKNSYTGSPNTLTTSLPAGYPGNPFSSSVYLSKVFYDLPRPFVDSAQVNSGINAGIAGDLAHGWRYDAGFSFARNVVKDHAEHNGFDFTALSTAMNSANKPVLAYDSSTVTDPSGLVAGLLSSYDHKDTTDVKEYSLNADGPVWAGWAGDIKLAIGLETQKESVEFSRTPAISYLLNAPFSRTTDAAYAEVSVPLLSEAQHLPLVHRLEVGAALRREHFSDLGTHDSPGVNLLYQPVKWISLRGSRTEGFKSPTLYSLLAPNYTTTTTITSSRNIVDTQRGNAPVVGTFVLTTGGQPHLKPETSVSRNAGIVVDLPWVKGLSASVDLWDLDYTDKVGTPSYQDLITFFPERITRDPSGAITGFDNSTINQASVKTKGVDYRLTYNRTTGWGDFMVSAAYTDTKPQITKATPSSKLSIWKQPERGTASVFWTRGPWTTGVAVNYQSSFPSYAGDTTPYDSYVEWNPQFGYDFGRAGFGTGDRASWWQRALADAKVTVTIVNAFNHEPTATEVAQNTYAMDPRLRRYIVSLTKKF